MNRADLAWALSAVLPHVGKRDPHNLVGLHYSDVLYAFATDRYTVGIARIEEGPHVSLALSVPEAQDLMRYVRPTLVATKEQEIVTGARPGELHIGLAETDDIEADSAVFDTIDADVVSQFDYITEFCRQLFIRPTEWDGCVYQPDLLARFAKAKRTDGDRLRLMPRHAQDLFGAALITVGTGFTGAIAGLTYEELQAAPLASFLQTERKSAA